MTAPTQRPASTSDARKRLAENTPAEPDADEREHIARLICGAHEGDGCRDWEDEDEAWRNTYRDMADAILAAGYSRTPGADLAAAKAEALEEAADSVDLSAYYDPSPTGHVSTSCHLGELAAREWLRARAARLREQGGE